MLAEEEIPDAPPWPGRDALCALLTARETEYEPLGFVAFEIMLPAAIAKDASGWIADDIGGRLLFLATQGQLYEAAELIVPRRDVPLLLWLTHRSLRVLYQCTPTEAHSLGRRLTVLARSAVGCDEVRECAPAVLAGLLWRLLLAAPRTVLAPDQPSGPEAVTRWCFPWSRPPLQPLLAVPAAMRQEQPAVYMTYDDDPTVLVPLRVLLEERRLTPREVLSTLKRHDELRAGLCVGPYGDLTCHVQYREVTVLAPAQGEGWRQRFTAFRDRLGEILHGDTACAPARQAALLALSRVLQRRGRDLPGRDEVYHPPFPGARTSPPDLRRGREVRRRLMWAVALPLGEEALHRVQVGEIYH
jgi:hypothetical protein